MPVKGVEGFMKFKNYFWGLFFILAAVFVIADQTGIFGEIGFWSIIATVFLVAIFIKSITKLNYFGIFAPIAILYSIYQQPLSWPEISLWKLLFAAILLSIGFHVLFGRHTCKFRFLNCSDRSINSKEETISGERLYTKTSFGQASKYLHSDCLKKGVFAVSFGQLNIYFDQVQLSPDGAVIELDCKFGEMVLYLPKTWHVEDKLHASFGSIENEHLSAADENAPKITLKGGVSCGDIKIIYV